MNRQSPTYLFQCGVGRSGTTVLRRSLGCHEQIYYNGFENNIIQDITKVALTNCTLKTRKRCMAVEQSAYNDAFRQLICSVTWPDASMHSLPVHMAAINPTADQLSFLLALFPEARVVAIVRNGIEVVSSRMQYKSFSENEFFSHCDVWNRSAAIADWGLNNESRFLLIRHEWLYDPELISANLDTMFDWLEIDRSDAPLKNVDSKLSHPTSSDVELGDAFDAIDQATKRRYFESKRDRWKSWTPEQRSMFKEKCARGMRNLGYEIPWD